MNIMSIEAYQAKIEYDAELDMFRGEILGLNGGADFYGRTPEELRAEFRRSLQVFLEVCREKGIEPRWDVVWKSILFPCPTHLGKNRGR